MQVVEAIRLTFFRGQDIHLHSATIDVKEFAMVEVWGSPLDGKKAMGSCKPSRQRLRVRSRQLETSLGGARNRRDAKDVQKKEKVIVISGPTGVGKSRLAIALARQIGGEIISADSVQVYKGLNVGSAKIPQVCREGIPHHLLDIVHPTQGYTAGNFCDDARKATNDILSRKRIPIVVGGTGMYLRWYMHGKPCTPKATEKLNALVNTELSGLLQKNDWDTAIQLLVKAGDPKTAKSISRNDWYRLCRALAIIKATGNPRVPYPHFGHHTKGTLTVKGLPRSSASSLQESTNVNSFAKELQYDFMCYFLHKTQRIDLYRSIDLRCEEMLAESNGLLAEASWLLDLGLEPNSSCPSRAIGYRQAMHYLSKCRKARGLSLHEDFVQFLSSFQHASRAYAKRQLTWFRSEPLFSWIDALQPLEKLIEHMSDEYHKPVGITLNSQLKVASHSVNSLELELLKVYKPQNRIFTGSHACAPIIEWIKKTQSV